MPTGPLAHVRLPDGQTISAVVVGRTRDRHGTWWYDLEITLLARIDRPRTAARAEPFTVRFTAPYPTVQPLPGQDYADLPAEHEEHLRWPLTPTRSSEGPAHTVHRIDCHQARHARRRLTDQAAAALLHRREATACPICRPDRALLRTDEAEWRDRERPAG